MTLKKIGWKNGTLVNKASVTINGIVYEVEPEQYSGETPLSAENLKKMEDNIENAINVVKTETLKLAFPIGSTYITQENTNPSEILKFGTWERLKGKVCLGLDEDDTDLNTIGNTGGEKTHTLTIPELADHEHQQTAEGKYGIEPGASAMCPTWGAIKGNTSAVTGSTGGGQPHNNMQPYKVVGYMWIRTA